MKERERIVVTALVLLMLLLWLGFSVHQSPRFAGSFWGGVLAVSGSLLMLVPLAYLVIKRVRFLKRKVTKWVSMRTLLAWHIYAGVLGPILVILHTGHKFESALGIALTGMTLLVVMSGFIGRYLMTYIRHEIREKREMLETLKKEFDRHAIELGGASEIKERMGVMRHIQYKMLNWVFSSGTFLAKLPPEVKVARLAESISDLEYAIASHQKIKGIFGVWLKFHIIISVVLYILMGLHVWASVYFGLRWFS